MSPASAEERETGLMAIERIKRTLGSTVAAEKLAAPPSPMVEQEEQPRHEDVCVYCRHEACWACDHAGRPLADCRHERPARHGAGDLTNPPLPEPEPQEEVAVADAE